MLVDMDLDISEEFRGVLHLIDEHGRPVKLKKQGRIVFCHVPLVEVIQRYIFSSDILFLRKRAKHGGFSSLTRSGYQDCGVGFAQFKDAGFHVPADIFHNAPPFSADFDSGYIIAEKRRTVNKNFGRF